MRLQIRQEIAVVAHLQIGIVVQMLSPAWKDKVIVMRTVNAKEILRVERTTVWLIFQRLPVIGLQELIVAPVVFINIAFYMHSYE